MVVHTSDITRAELVRLPWDYQLYGYQPDDRDVVEAVRASMSIPFFFEPVTFEARTADVDLPAPGGGSITRHYDGGTVTWVDGGMLRNFPINAFDRADGLPPRWPTIGIKLSSLQTQFAPTTACESAVAVGVHCLRTMMNEWDAYSVDESTAGRTIFVDNGGLTATDFSLTPDQQDRLFLNGVTAASAFVMAMAEARGVPRTAEEARRLVRARRDG
jgi:NTE family protein